MTQKQQHKKLGDTLWNIANDLRGAMNADDFRDYMLSFIFLRYLSFNYEQAAKKELGRDYPPIRSTDSRPDFMVPPPLEDWYRDNKEDIADFEDSMRRKVHYVIKPEFLWSNITHLAGKQDDDLLKTLEKGFRYIENDSFESTFRGLFSEINLNSEKLGKSEKERNDKLSKIIIKIATGIADFSTDVETLGDAYEYLIGKFAAGSGKKAGEFYTPQEISSILSQIVLLDSHDPAHPEGPKKKLDKVLDFACGSGSLLLNVRNQLKNQTKGNGTIGKIYGQEKNITTYNLARMNMLLHGMKDTEFDIFHGDTLLNQWDLLNELNPSKKIEFDAIVANPPFSLRWTPNEAMGEDFRFKSYGLAPKSAADFAFLLHGFHFLSKEGTMAIILPHGVLFRGGAEERIRTKLLKDNHIDTIIGLPSNLFYSTGIPVCILVLKKCKKQDDVLFINAVEHYKKEKRQNTLSEKHIQSIVEAYKLRSDRERYSRKVSMVEIEKNNYNLNISRYVSTAEPEPIVDLKEVHTELERIERKINSSTNKHNEFLKELGLKTI
ncbi:MAG: type I restriction-modification system subunit M [Flavobacteriales bacterium]